MVTMAAAKNTPSDSEGTAVTDETVTLATATADTADDDLRRRYREALERKRAGGSAAATGHGADKAGAPTSNDKVKRTFRRRAGG
jgi:Family of unknown function (DUF5302)